MFKILLAVLVCFGFAISSAEAKKNRQHKAKNKMAFNVELTGFKNQSKDKQVALIKALREWALSAEGMHKLKGASSKNAFLFSLIEQAAAEDPPEKGEEGKEAKKEKPTHGSNEGQICTFAGWFTKTTGTHGRGYCRHPEETKDVDFEYTGGTCIGKGRNRTTDGANRQVLCNPFIAGAPKDDNDKSRCMGFGSPTASCLAIEGSLEAAVAYAVENAEEFEKYLGRAVDFCEGTKAVEADEEKGVKAKDADEAEVNEIENKRVKADQIATCKNLMSRLNDVKAKIEPAKEAKEDAEELKEVKLADTATEICSYTSDGELHRIFVEGNELKIRNKKELAVSIPLATQGQHQQTKRLGKHHQWAIKTDLGYVSIYQKMSGSDRQTCDGSWFSLTSDNKDNTPTKLTGNYSCTYKRDGDTSAGPHFEIRYPTEDEGNCTIYANSGKESKVLVSGKMSAGKCRFSINENKRGRGLPVVFSAEEGKCGRFSIDMEKSSGGSDVEKSRAPQSE